MKYTENMQNELKLALDKDLDGDNVGDAGLEFLNRKDGFRSFGDGLLTGEVEDVVEEGNRLIQFH